MLSRQQHLDWDEYLALEQKGFRGDALHSLRMFLDTLIELQLEDWRIWACDIARRVVDESEKLPVRMPLFRRAIFPALKIGTLRHQRGCARWLAGFSQYLYQCNDLQLELPDELQTENGLLLAALDLDSNDVRSRRRLVKMLADRLQYTIHELPTGILYGANGATSDECLQLEQELLEFQELLRVDDGGSRYELLIDKCRFHFREYRSYQLAKRSPSYAIHLSLIGDC